MTGLDYACSITRPKTHDRVPWYFVHETQIPQPFKAGRHVFPLYSSTLFSPENAKGSPFSLEVAQEQDYLLPWEKPVWHEASKAHYYCADPSNPAYSDDWAAAAVQKCRELRAHGILMDSVYPIYLGMVRGTPPTPAYADNNKWITAMAAHVTRVKRIINAAGYKLWGNTAFTPQFVHLLDGTMIQHAIVSNNNYQTPTEIHAAIENIRSHKLPVVVVPSIQVTAEDYDAKVRFALACWLIARKAEDPFAIEDFGEAWHPAMGKALEYGKALTLPKRVGDTWTRRYQGGSVTVNVVTHEVSMP